LIVEDPNLAATFEGAFDADWDGRSTSGIDAWRVEDPRALVALYAFVAVASAVSLRKLRARAKDIKPRARVRTRGASGARLRGRILPVPRGDARDGGGAVLLRTRDPWLRDGGGGDRNRGGLPHRDSEREPRPGIRGAGPLLVDRSLVLPVPLHRRARHRACDPRPLCDARRPRLHRLNSGETETVRLEDARAVRATRCDRDERGPPHPGRVEDGPRSARAAVLSHPAGRRVLRPPRGRVREAAALWNHPVRRHIVRDRVQRGPAEACPR